jgi:hypothetical protein
MNKLVYKVNMTARANYSPHKIKAFIAGISQTKQSIEVNKTALHANNTHHKQIIFIDE